MKTIVIAGNVGKAELKQAGGSDLLRFSVAVNGRAKVDGAWEKTTTWFECSMWGKRAAAIGSYVTKGTKVAVSGDLTVREYVSGSGEKRSSLDVNVSELTLQGGSSGGGYGGPPKANDYTTDMGGGGADDFGDDDIPFCPRDGRLP